MLYTFPRPQKYQIEVRRSQTGLGLFAVGDIPKGAFVIEYWGDVVTEEEGNRRGGKYLFDLENGNMIDGKSRKNIARYINHACTGNCDVDIVGNRIFIVAVKNIKTGEQLTYDYGKEYFDEYIKPFGCKCGKCAKK